jgi:hypothetical protein
MAVGFVFLPLLLHVSLTFPLPLLSFLPFRKSLFRSSRSVFIVYHCCLSGCNSSQQKLLPWRSRNSNKKRKGRKEKKRKEKKRERKGHFSIPPSHLTLSSSSSCSSPSPLLVIVSCCFRLTTFDIRYSKKISPTFLQPCLRTETIQRRSSSERVYVK